VPATSLAAVSAPVASAVAQAKSAAPAAAAPAVLAGGADLSLTWVTLVTPEPALETFAAGLPPALRPLATGLVAVMLGALLAAGGWTAAGGWSFAARQWSRARGLGMRARVGKARMSYVMQRIAEQLSLRRGRREPRTTTSVANAAASVTALLEKADGAIQSLERAPPLRDVLSGELIHIRQRLVITKAQASESAEAAAKAAPACRALVRDLERLRRISESAALSMAGRRETSRLPMTRGEAYDFLGVNADVPDATLKKLVDALRVCWHPDLARDERDRLEREERIKCINVSWELISGKRAAA